LIQILKTPWNISRLCGTKPPKWKKIGHPQLDSGAAARAKVGPAPTRCADSARAAQHQRTDQRAEKKCRLSARKTQLQNQDKITVHAFATDVLQNATDYCWLNGTPNENQSCARRWKEDAPRGAVGAA
jgi:hypothetical protein